MSGTVLGAGVNSDKLEWGLLKGNLCSHDRRQKTCRCIEIVILDGEQGCERNKLGDVIAGTWGVDDFR